MRHGPFDGVEAIKALREAVEERQRNDHGTKTPSDITALLQLIKGQARDAINATALSEVVRAIRTRNKRSKYRIAIRCHIVGDGEPKQYRWQTATRRFCVSPGSGGGEPALTVMAPSDSLVRKHHDRLPVGEYAVLAMRYGYDLKRITPSNQLSYVIRAEHKSQGILISGDTGLVDFVKKVMPPRDYYKSLLDELMPLDVVQVAHHGGNNWYFYEVLMESGYGNQRKPTFLLLSHAVNDYYRPSKVFGDFMRDLDRKPCSARILFTSRPKSRHVKSFKSMIEPPSGPVSDEGVIRISFDQGQWSVDRHSVRV